MRLTYAHIADYASVASDGKLTIVGAFDVVWRRDGMRPVPFPPFYVVAGFEASLSEGPEHSIEVALVNDDEEGTGLVLNGVLHFRASGVGHPARANIIVGFGPGAVAVPDIGDYHLRFSVGGTLVGTLRVTVLPAPDRG